MAVRSSVGEVLLESMSRAECIRFLGRSRVGRVGITVDALPVILPVNFCVIDAVVHFATVPGTKLDAATHEAVIAFQADAYAPDGSAGWSVLAVGRSSRVTDPTSLARFRTERVSPWPHGDRAEHVVRIELADVRGRRFGDVSNPWLLLH
jgi:uncharacterized protein